MEKNIRFLNLKSTSCFQTPKIVINYQIFKLNIGHKFVERGDILNDVGINPPSCQVRNKGD